MTADLRALLRGAVVLDALEVDRAEIHLEEDREGRGNWQLGGQIGAGGKDPAAAPTRLRIARGSLLYGNYDYRAALGDYDAALKLDIVGKFLRYGFVILHDVPSTDQALFSVAETFGFVRDTNFGPVFDVRPGIIRSDMTAGVAGAYESMIAGGLVPARRWGEGSDIGRVVAALARGDFAFATGSVIDVDGGLSIPRL